MKKKRERERGRRSERWVDLTLHIFAADASDSAEGKERIAENGFRVVSEPGACFLIFIGWCSAR